MPKKYHQEYQDRVESHFDVSILTIPILIIGIIMAIQLYFTNIFNEKYILFFSICVVLLFGSMILNDKGILRYRSHKLALLTAAHVFAGLGLLYFTNPTVPYSYAWILLSVVTFEEFKYKGLTLSLSVYALVLLSYLMFFGDINTTTITLFVAQLSIVSLISIVLAQSRYLSTHELQELIKTSQSEEFERQRLQTLINSMKDAVMIINGQGYINQYNAILLSILDTNLQIKNANVDDLFKLKDAKGRPFKFRKILKDLNSSTSLELINDIGMGESVVLDVEISQVKVSYKNSMQEGFIVIAKDITKKKSLEEERDEFISVVSHELRTPVATAEASISNALFFLEKKDTNQDKIENSITEAHKQVVSMGEMLGDISNLSRAEKDISQADCAVISPKEIRDDIFSAFKERAEEKGLVLKVKVQSDAPSISTSKIYLTEVVNNLVSNAIKYTEKGSVTIELTLINNSDLRISVKDSGIGLSKNDQKHIFDKFWRSEDYKTRKSNGMGLGLYVTKKLVQKIGGKISVNSQKDEGSEFIIEIGNLR